MDELANGTETTDVFEEEEEDLTFGHPATLGITALVLAFLSLIGASVFRGAAYTSGLARHANNMGDITGNSKTAAVSGAFLTAAFALIPVVLARSALSKLVPADGQWTAHLARAAMLLALLALALHLVLAVIVMSNYNETTSIFSSV